MPANVPGLIVAGGFPGSRGVLYCGGFDPMTDTIYLGPAGHPDGMLIAGGRPRPGETPGLTVLEDTSVVVWANDSRSLLLPALTDRQAALIQDRLTVYFHPKPVRRVPTVD